MAKVVSNGFDGHPRAFSATRNASCETPKEIPLRTLPRRVVLADDLTGALEIGVLGRAAGHHSMVILAGTPLSDDLAHAAILVLDTDTRELSSAAASDVCRRILAHLLDQENLDIFKKTDSLLRGNIAAELASLRSGFPGRKLVYVPAYPLLGRTVRNGILTVHGQDGSSEVGDVFSLLETAIPRIELQHVRGDEDLQSWLLKEPSSVLVCDAETQAQVEAFGETLKSQSGRCIVAGPAGIFRSLFGYVAASGQPEFPVSLPTGVGFIGSTHPVSNAQLEALATSARAEIAEAQGSDFGSYLPLWHSARNDGKWLMLRAQPDRSAAPSMRFSPVPDALYLSGGATAAACLSLLHCRALEPMRELLPGVVLSHARMQDRVLPVITKSGAFGDANTLVRLLAMLQGEEALR